MSLVENSKYLFLFWNEGKTTRRHLKTIFFYLLGTYARFLDQPYPE